MIRFDYSSRVKVSRRDLIRGALAGGAVAAAGGKLTGCGNEVVPAPTIEGAVDDDPASPSYGQVAVEFGRYPALDEVGGAVTVKLTPPSDGRARPFRVPSGILLVRRGAPADPPEWAAMESTCTHASCPLGYSQKDALVECPCHQSRFRLAADPAVPGSCPGEVVHLPARQGPTVYEVVPSGDLTLVYILLNSTLGCSTLPPLAAGKVHAAVGRFAALQQNGGAVVGTPGGFTDPIAVVRVDASTVAAVNARCTHLGCTVAWQRDRFQCPCHESAFALDGRVLPGDGPARRSLATYAVEFDGTRVVVTLV